MHVGGRTHLIEMDPDTDQNQTSYKIIDLPRPTMNVCRMQAVQSLTGSRRLSSESCGNMRQSFTHALPLAAIFQF